MNPMILNELKLNSKIMKDEDPSSLLEAIKTVVKLSNLARHEGLLALEEAARSMDDTSPLKNLIILIVDGTEPELVEDISFFRYIADGYEGRAAVEYLIYLVGTLSIQAGENPRVTEEKLLAMVPSYAAKRYRAAQEAELGAEKKKRQEEYDGGKTPEVVTKLYEGETISMPAGEPGYFVVALLDYLLKNMDDRTVQRILREVENSDLEVVLHGLSGAGRKKILTNLSKRLACMVAEDYNFLGPVKAVDISAIAEKILRIIYKLENSGEIILNDACITGRLCELFALRPKDYEREWEINQEHELEELFREYKKQARQKR